MEDLTREDIRKLLKTFGIQADEAITVHLERYPGGEPLHLRLRLEDLTDYDSPPEQALELQVEGQLRR